MDDKRILHKLGYYSNQEGIGRRYIRESANWSNHLSSTKRFIINAVKKSRPEVVTLLGSGWLLDIPVGEILKYCSQVRLVDIVQPPDISVSLAGESRVVQVTEDVTGGLPSLAWDYVKSKVKPSPEEIIREVEALDYNPSGNQGLVVSVNLLSQLAVLPFRYLLKKRIVTEDLYPAFAAAVQESHLRFLRKRDAVLVTDYAESHLERNGTVLREEVVHCRLPAGTRRDEWSWDFDTKGTYQQGVKTVMQVVAVQL